MSQIGESISKTYHPVKDIYLEFLKAETYRSIIRKINNPTLKYEQTIWINTSLKNIYS